VHTHTTITTTSEKVPCNNYSYGWRKMLGDREGRVGPCGRPSCGALALADCGSNGVPRSKTCIGTWIGRPPSAGYTTRSTVQARVSLTCPSCQGHATSIVWQGFLFQVRSKDAYCRYLLYVPLHIATTNTTVSSYSDFYQDGRRLERDLTTVITSYVFFLVPKGRLHQVTCKSHDQLCCPLSGCRCGFPLIPFLVCKAHTPHHPTEEAGPLAVLARVHL